MNDLRATVAERLLRHTSVVLVGATNAGKTHWARHTLTPYLQSLGRRVAYLEDGDALLHDASDIVICDEAETLCDAELLQSDVPEPYYTDTYLQKVKRWHARYAVLPLSTLFIITRNEPLQITYLLRHFTKADWDGRDVAVVQFCLPRSN